jgi:hypothetical protein
LCEKNSGGNYGRLSGPPGLLHNPETRVVKASKGCWGFVACQEQETKWAAQEETQKIGEMPFSSDGSLESLLLEKRKAFEAKFSYFTFKHRGHLPDNPGRKYA